MNKEIASRVVVFLLTAGVYVLGFYVPVVHVILSSMLVLFVCMAAATPPYGVSND